MKNSTKQIGGTHYSSLAIQPVDYVMDNNPDYLQGNVIKYITRYKYKNGLEDLRKAKHYINMMMDREKEEEEHGFS